MPAVFRGMLARLRTRTRLTSCRLNVSMFPQPPLGSKRKRNPEPAILKSQIHQKMSRALLPCRKMYLTQSSHASSNFQHLIIRHYYSCSTINNALSPSCLSHHRLTLRQPVLYLAYHLIPFVGSKTVSHFPEAYCPSRTITALEQNEFLTVETTTTSYTASSSPFSSKCSTTV